MITLILIAILFGSLIGIIVILYRRIPDLVKLSEDPLNWRVGFLPKIKKEVRKLPGAKTLDYELYLQKMLSRVRVLTLKTENKTGNWLERLRQKSNQKSNQKSDTYWEELRKTKDGR
jgi:hypothetical protein